jgi:hypothetical protein
VPSSRRNGAIFPQTVRGENVEIGGNQSRHQLIRVAPCAELRSKRLNGKRPPLRQIDGTLFVADTKHACGRAGGHHCFSEPAHALKQAASFTRNAADQKTDFHVGKEWTRVSYSNLINVRPSSEAFRGLLSASCVACSNPSPKLSGAKSAATL